MALNDAIAPWQHTGLWIIKQTTWGTGIYASMVRLPARTRTLPDLQRPLQKGPMVGQGTAMPLQRQFQQGRKSTAFSTEHPLTSTVMHYILSVMGMSYSGAGNQKTYVAYTDAKLAKWATVVGQADPGAAANENWDAIGAVPTQARIAIGAAEGDGVATVAVDWIGEGPGAGTDPSTTTEDAGTFAQIFDCAFTIGGVAKKFSSAEIVITNTASLIYDSDETPSGVILGDISITGNLTVLLTGAADEADSLRTAYSAKTQQRLGFDWTAGSIGVSNQCTFDIYGYLTGPPAISEQAGVLVAQFPWEMHDDGTNSWSCIVSNNAAWTF